MSKILKISGWLIIGICLCCWLLPTIDAHALGHSSIINPNGSLNLNNGLGVQAAESAWSDILSRYKGFAVGLSGVGAVSMIAFFIVNFLKLGAVSSNPSERSKVLNGLIWSGVAAACLGSVTMIVGFLYRTTI